jgi:hypothetical protein
MPSLDLTTLLYYLAAAGAGWLLRHWGVFAPAVPQSPTPAAPPAGTGSSLAPLWEELKADAEKAIAAALKSAMSTAVSSIQPTLPAPPSTPATPAAK